MEKVQKQVTDEHKFKGFDGRFGPGLPRVSDGSPAVPDAPRQQDARSPGWRLSHWYHSERLTAVHRGAGSGESEIRRYLLQSDMVEAIVALPTDMFYNTGISTYIWILSNNKPAERKGKVQLIDASDRASKMRKSLGSKRQLVSEADQDEIVRLYGEFQGTEKSKIFPNDAFGYRRITVERPLRLNFQTSEERIARITEEKAIQKMPVEEQEKILAACRAMDSNTLHQNRPKFQKLLKASLTDHQVYPGTPQLKALLNALSERDPEADVCESKGKPEPDSGLRDNENVPLGESVCTTTSSGK